MVKNILAALQQKMGVGEVGGESTVIFGLEMQDVQHKHRAKKVSSLPLGADTRTTQQRDHTCHVVSGIVPDKTSAVLAPTKFWQALSTCKC